MRKFIIGILVGALLTLTGSVYADDIKSLIGATIQGEFPVKVKGQPVEEKAIVINGTSYLPVRAIGEALDLDVSFNADLGIELKERVTGNVYTEPPKWSWTPTVSTPSQVSETTSSAEVLRLNDLISKTKDAKAQLENYLHELKNSGASTESIEAAITNRAPMLQALNDKIIEYEAQLSAELKAHQ